MNTKIFKRILITGVAGSGGSYLAESILKKYPDSKILGLRRSHTSGNSDNLTAVKDKIQVISCDLLDQGNLYRCIKDFAPTVIFNVASQANVLDSFHNSNSTLQNNVMLMSNLLEVLRNLSYRSLLIHCSTSEVYGKVEESEIPIIETQPMRPASPYSVSKITQDLLCDVYVKSFNLLIIKTRMFTYINPKRSDLFASSFAKQIAEIEKGIRVYLEHGNLESVRTILDVRDAMDAYIAVAESGVPGEIYNIGGNTKTTVAEFLNLLISKSSMKIDTRQNPQLLRPMDVTLQIPNDNKFRNQTGWKPKYSIDETANHLLSHWRYEVSKN